MEKVDLNQDGKIDFDEFRNGIKKICEYLKTNHNKAKIIFFTPFNRRDSNYNKYSKYLVDACNNYNYPVYNFTESEVVIPYDKDFRFKYMQSRDDKAHLNKHGHDLVLSLVEKFILDNTK